MGGGVGGRGRNVTTGVSCLRGLLTTDPEKEGVKSRDGRGESEKANIMDAEVWRGGWSQNSTLETAPLSHYLPQVL